MSKIWQFPKSLANAVPKYQSRHPCNLNTKQTCCCIHQALNLFVTLQNRFAQPTMCHTHEDNFASRKRIMYHCQHPIFSSHCCAIFGRFNKVPNFGCCNVGGVFANLWRIHCLQWHSIDLARIAHANMLVRPSLTTSRLLVSCLAQLSLQCFCMPQQDLPFGDKSLTFVTRHYVIVFPASWSTSFGSTIRHRLSKVDSIAQFRQREAPLLLYMFVNPACWCYWQPMFHEHANTLNQMASLVVVVSALFQQFFPTSTTLYLGVNFWPLIECILHCGEISNLAGLQ